MQGAPAIVKELRALLPAWAAVAVAILSASQIYALRPFTGAVYAIGVAALGAMSLGHEFSHGTLPLLLTQPVSRQRLLLAKLGVLAAALLSLVVLASFVVPILRPHALWRQLVLWSPAMAAMFMTPYLTMISRSPVGGAVFTVGIAGVLAVAGEWIGIAKYGYTANVDTYRITFLWRWITALSVASAVLLWWGFLRLQAVDGRGAAIDLAPAAGAKPTTLTKRNVTWLLIEKELRLQQLSFGIAAIYAVLYLITVARTRGLFGQNDAAFIESMLYAAIVSVVIGSVASAEERHLRTLDAQLLLPARTSRQWAIKVAVVLGLTFVLGIALPAVLASVFPTERIVWARALQSFAAASSVLALMAIATVSLYVSTLCSSGLWALLLSVPSALAAALFVLKLGSIVEGWLYSFGGRLRGPLVDWAAVVMTAAVIGLVLRLALENHRSADRPRWRIATQVALGAAAVVVAITVVGVVGLLSR